MKIEEINKKTISILIPVYKEPKLLEDIIKKLLSDKFEDKEILIGVDGETTEEIEKVFKKYIGKIEVYYTKKRCGKAHTLNILSKLSNGEILLFLDNDVELPDDKDFLLKLSKEAEKYDIVEISKEAKINNFFTKIISYDFLVASSLCFIISRIFKTNLFLSGAAFAIKKEVFEELKGFAKVINEDWNLMLKAFSLKKSYKFLTDIKVKTLVPSNISEWIKQRRRWVLGIKFWWLEIFRNIKQYIRSFPIIFNAILFSVIPITLPLLIKKFDIASKFFLMIFILSQHLSKHFGLTSFVYFVFLLFLMLKGIMPLLISFFISSVTFFIFSKLLKFKFNFFEFFIYCFIYLPFLNLSYFWFFLSESLKNISSKFDWIVEENI